MNVRRVRRCLIALVLLASSVAVTAAPLAPSDPAGLRALRDSAAVALDTLASADAALPAAIAGESDARLQEAMWSAWLDRLARRDRLLAVEQRALQELVDFEPVVQARHHDHPDRAWPAFRIASRARAVLQRAAIDRAADELRADPDAIVEALTGPVTDAATFRAAVSAARRMDIAWQRRAADELAGRAANDPAAARAVVELFRGRPALGPALRQVVSTSAPAIARDALHAAIRHRPAELEAIAEAALDRPELGGLAVAAMRQAGRDVDAFCWPLLADPTLGADAARALAEQSGRLVETIAAQIDEADAHSRRRMLLALMLRDSGPSRRLLGELAKAPWLDAQQRLEVVQWLR